MKGSKLIQQGDPPRFVYHKPEIQKSFSNTQSENSWFVRHKTTAYHPNLFAHSNILRSGTDFIFVKSNSQITINVSI